MLLVVARRGAYVVGCGWEGVYVVGCGGAGRALGGGEGGGLLVPKLGNKREFDQEFPPGWNTKD